MFKKNYDSMRMEPTPERVLAVCRLASQCQISRDQMKEYLTLGQMGDKEVDTVNRSLAVALDELHLLQEKNDVISYVGPVDALKSGKAFRQCAASIIFGAKDSTFVLFSKWVINKNEELFALGNWETIAATCSKNESELARIDENAVLGWRFWAAFLGLGYLSGTMFLPNMKVRLQDLLETSFPQKFQYDEAIRAEEFIPWLSSKMPEVDFDNIRILPLALSSALRTLHELELIKLETRQDSKRVYLHYVDGEMLNDFSLITVRKGVCE